MERRLRGRRGGLVGVGARGVDGVERAWGVDGVGASTARTTGGVDGVDAAGLRQRGVERSARASSSSSSRELANLGIDPLL